MRFIVLCDEGKPLRSFYTRAEAIAFCLSGYSIIEKPKPEKPPLHWGFRKAHDLVGDAPF
jgi:hypothetical protein